MGESFKQPRRTAAALATLALGAALATGCGSNGSGGGGSTPGQPITPTPPPITPTTETLVGAGDIAMCNEPGAAQTARLLDTIAGTVFAAGDLAYMQGSERNFRECYAPTWGRHRDRTYPVPGNHEYETPGAAAYFAYFGARAGMPGRGYYSYRLGAWLVLALDSNVPMGAGSPQYEWLRAELQANPTTCTLAYAHHPLFSSGPNGGSSRMRPVWDLLYQHGAEIVLTGDDHLYDRQAPQDPTGRYDPTRGIREFVVGTGGATLYQVVKPGANSEVRYSGWGVLKLTLAESSYSWEFIPVEGGSFRDSGSGSCH
jgi:3',5'-cyclic AMP phosphodiesterase CpdA